MEKKCWFIKYTTYKDCIKIVLDNSLHKFGTIPLIIFN